MNEGDPRIVDETTQRMAARHAGETLVGCVGIACVLLTLPLLWLTFGGGPLWLSRLAPLGIFTVIVVGVALTMRVPGALTPRSTDPLRPLTRAGARPLLERPATAASRASLALAVALIALALVGYFVAALTGGGRLAWVLPVAAVAGVGLIAQGSLVAGGRFPPPALRWQRLTIGGGAPVPGAALTGVGFLFTGAALLLAVIEAYTWGFIGSALLLLALVFAAPLARRWPRSGDHDSRDGWDHEDER